MKRFIYTITILLFASAIALCRDPQGKPDLIIESVHLQWIPIVYGPNHPPRGGDQQVRGIFTLLIRNIGQADFQDAFYIQISFPRRFGAALPETEVSLVNRAKNQIKVGESLPVELYIRQRKLGLLKFVILDEMVDAYHNIKFFLNDGDMTNNSFEYRFGQEGK
jgi:hypothetical protein